MRDAVFKVVNACCDQSIADQLTCEADQVVRSEVYRGASSAAAMLFLVAGNRRVNGAQASGLAYEAAYPADLAFIRTQTGFEPDSVPPTGHAHPIRAWMDPRLLEFDKVWACAGAPALVFSIDPEALRRLAGAVAGDFTGYWAASS
ncbi:YbaK/EbsC family protein [Salipiger mucosus]|uniref:YbaK/EbsC family protein n=1 Tax=Salipiger mucosus TaxID=263378 RepID=UPI0003701DFE|nr:YbaK/EbsC family protein [Salipiger mucosus]